MIGCIQDDVMTEPMPIPAKQSERFENDIHQKNRRRKTTHLNPNLDSGIHLIPSSNVAHSVRGLRWILLLVILGPLVTRAEKDTLRKDGESSAQFRQGLEVLQLAYRKSLAELLAEADKVEILLLDFEMTEERIDDPWDPGVLPIKPYEKGSKILKRKELSVSERKRLLPGLQVNLALKEDSGGAMCHFPIHGLRFWVGDRILFQSSFCWTCRNYYMEYPDFNSRWLGISDPELEKTMRALMPIPDSEVERFKAKFPGPKL